MQQVYHMAHARLQVQVLRVSWSGTQAQRQQNGSLRITCQPAIHLSCAVLWIVANDRNSRQERIGSDSEVYNIGVWVNGTLHDEHARS